MNKIYIFKHCGKRFKVTIDSKHLASVVGYTIDRIYLPFLNITLPRIGRLDSGFFSTRNYGVIDKNSGQEVARQILRNYLNV